MLLLTFQQEDADIANEVQSFNHQAYVVSKRITCCTSSFWWWSHEVKRIMAANLQTTRRPRVFCPGKPNFPTWHFLRDQGVALPDLIGPKSSLIFQLLGSNGGWLGLNPCHWDNDGDYQVMKNTSKHVAVFNDAAELWTFRNMQTLQEMLGIVATLPCVKFSPHQNSWVPEKWTRKQTLSKTKQLKMWMFLTKSKTNLCWEI